MFKDPKIQLALGSFIVWAGDWTGSLRETAHMQKC